MKKTTGSKRRRIEQKQIIVLMDDEGHFYELPRATLKARVPEAQEDEVEEKLEGRNANLFA